MNNEFIKNKLINLINKFKNIANGKYVELHNKIKIKKILAEFDNFNVDYKIVDYTKKLVPKLSQFPDVYPTQRNSIQIQYEINDKYLEIEIFCDRAVIYYDDNKTNREFVARLYKLDFVVNLYIKYLL